MSPAEAERRIVVSALVGRRFNGAASHEIVIRRAGLSRVVGWATLASLDRSGAIWEDVDGIAVGWLGRMYAGLPDPPPAPYVVGATSAALASSVAATSTAIATPAGADEPEPENELAGIAPSREIVTCSVCGNPYELSDRRAREIRSGAVPRCFDCRYPNRSTPGPREHRWVQRLDETTRERALAAVSALL